MNSVLAVWLLFRFCSLDYLILDFGTCSLAHFVHFIPTVGDDRHNTRTSVCMTTAILITISLLYLLLLSIPFTVSSSGQEVFILKAKCDARWWSIDNVPIILSNIPHKPYLSAREFVLIVQSMWVSWWVRGRMNVDLYVNIVANNILFACVSMYIMSAMKCFFLLRR